MVFGADKKRNASGSSHGLAAHNTKIAAAHVGQTCFWGVANIIPPFNEFELF